MEIEALPAFTDNYIWMLHNGHQAVVVDPGDAQPVLNALSQRGLALHSILVTHRHPDHINGLPRLQQTFHGPVYGPAALVGHGVNHAVREGDEIQIMGLRFQVWETPGHTNDHLSYICDAFPFDCGPQVAVWSGDILFSAGCGRVFEGNAYTLFASLNRLAHLPDQTKIFATHEYTLSNLRFAQVVEPCNAQLHSHVLSCEAKRQQNLPTLPTTLAIERQINPFLRCAEPDVIAAAMQHGAKSEQPDHVFAALRAWKNQF